MTAATEATETTPRRGSPVEVLRIFLRLGLTSFGGPVAHLGYYRSEFVERRRWLDEHAFADIVALCQFLPGPASSQVGMSIGILRAGLPGAFAAWLGFTMPSAIAMILFGYGVTRFGDLSGAAWLHGLKIVAVAVVAQAVWGMARSLCPDKERASVAVAAAILALAVPSAWGQVGAIAAGGLIGWALLGNNPVVRETAPLAIHLPRSWSIAAIVLFFGLLIGLPLLAAAVPVQPLKLFDSFYRSGALVFGGGHVVLPLLQAEVVPPGWVSNDAFLAGYGAAQAVPGPLFTFSAYLGTVMGTGAERLARRPVVPGGDLPAVLSAAGRRAAVLGAPTAAPGGAIGFARRQRGGRRPVAGGALPAGMDQRDLHARRFRARHPGVPAAGAVGRAAMARRHPRRARRHGGRRHRVGGTS